MTFYMWGKSNSNHIQILTCHACQYSISEVGKLTCQVLCISPNSSTNIETSLLSGINSKQYIFMIITIKMPYDSKINLHLKMQHGWINLSLVPEHFIFKTIKHTEYSWYNATPNVCFFQVKKKNDYKSHSNWQTH